MELDVPSIVGNGQSNGALVCVIRLASVSQCEVICREVTQREFGAVGYTSTAAAGSSVVLRGIPHAVGWPEECDRAHDCSLSSSAVNFSGGGQLLQSAAGEKSDGDAGRNHVEYKLQGN